MWFKNFGWEKNPFCTKSSTALVGLERQKQLLKDYASSGDICIIMGESGTGKTSLLLWLEKNLEGHKKVYLSGEIMDEFFSIEKFIKRKVWLGRKKIVLLLDEADHCTEDHRKELKRLWDAGKIKSLVIAQAKKDLGEYGKNFRNRIGNRVIKVSGLEFEEAQEMIKLRTENINPFTEDALSLIFDVSNIPRKILENCELTCIELQGKGLNESYVKEVLEKKKEEELENIVSLEEPTLPNNLMPRDSLDLKGFSPMQQRLIKILLDGGKTGKQLATVLNTSEGSVGKQLSKLTEMKVVKIVNPRRPKVYGISEQFKASLL